MAAGTIKTTTPHTEKWTGFIDVVFGAIVALGIEKYGDFFPQAWHGGVGVFLLSLLVSIAVCSFVVYDIAVYHDLTIQYPYRSTFRGFVRFYLDLIMALILYVLLTNASTVNLDWTRILVPISIWHVAAFAWHLLAQSEYETLKKGKGIPFGSHLWFIAIYWIVALLSYALGKKILGLDDTLLSMLILGTSSLTILAVSISRWTVVIKSLSKS